MFTRTGVALLLEGLKHLAEVNIVSIVSTPPNRPQLGSQTDEGLYFVVCSRRSCECALAENGEPRALLLLSRENCDFDTMIGHLLAKNAGDRS